VSGWLAADDARPARERTIVILAIVFLAWFGMRFHMDTASDSQTNAYVDALLASIRQHTLAADGTGHYSLLAAVFMWPIATALERVTGAYQIRGLVVALLLLSTALYAAAYAWYRRVGLGWFSSLIGLAILSTSVAFATQIRGWEIDKLIEPTLFLVAALAAWDEHYVLVVVIAALAALNRETGAFVPFVALAAVAQRQGGFRAALTAWPVWACAVVCVLEIGLLRQLGPAPTVKRFWPDLNLERLGYLTGGLCLTPLLALAWFNSAPSGLKQLFLLAPIWVVFVLATDQLEQGLVLIAPLALLFVPITLAGVEQALRGAVPAPVAPAER
jgi:hypothetical protein